MTALTTSPRSRSIATMRRGSSVRVLVASLSSATLLALAACGSPPAPPPPPAPTASVDAPSGAALPGDPEAASTAASTAALTAASTPAPTVATVVIRRSEIYATVVSRKGKVLDTLSMLMTSESLPPVGTKALLFRKARKGEAGDWIPLADVTIDKLGDGGSILLTLGEEKVGAKGETYKKNLAIKIQIDR